MFSMVENVKVFPMSNWLGLRSAWVTGKDLFSGYTANSPNGYPRLTFNLDGY